ncbi:hypothetical protein GCM10009530_56780 [Microbispora corallina]|uniref:Uncharacterized protein n=1 Tax=Microbispora corallina TaxID=83302 RepID=A0ABQ4G8W1_9ACTN|nr:hypothetical protein Mco01_65000 [Microbispora corallina]
MREPVTVILIALGYTAEAEWLTWGATRKEIDTPLEVLEVHLPDVALYQWGGLSRLRDRRMVSVHLVSDSPVGYERLGSPLRELVEQEWPKTSTLDGHGQATAPSEQFDAGPVRQGGFQLFNHGRSVPRS